MLGAPPGFARLDHHGPADWPFRAALEVYDRHTQQNAIDLMDEDDVDLEAKLREWDLRQSSWPGTHRDAARSCGRGLRAGGYPPTAQRPKVGRNGTSRQPALDRGFLERLPLVTLSLVENIMDGIAGFDGLQGVFGLALSPDGAHLYVVNGGSNRFLVFSRDAGTGTLTFVEEHQGGLFGLGSLDDPEAVGVGPDGTRVYVSARRGVSLITYARDALTGTLTVERIEQGKPGRFFAAFGLEVLPDGTQVLGAPDTQGNVMFFRADGRYRFTDGTRTAMQPIDLAVSPDGRFLYIPDSGIRGIAVDELTNICPPTPQVGCRQPARAKLVLRNSELGDQQDLVTLSWVRGDEVTDAALGDPVDFVAGTTFYGLCLYDTSSGATLIGEAVVPSENGCTSEKPCWKEGGPAGKRRVRMVSPLGRPDGLTRVLAQAGEAGKPSLKMKAKGVLTELPMPPFVPPVVAQAVTTDGECWEATFAADDVRRNIGPPGITFGQFIGVQKE